MDEAELLPLPDESERILIAVAHPDDVAFALGPAVARWTATGRWVGCLLVSRGEAGIDSIAPERAGRLREREERAAAAALGIGRIEFLAHPDGVIEYGLTLRRDLTAAIRRHRPEAIVSLGPGPRAPGGGFHMADHRAVGLAAIDAARDAGNRWVFPDLPDPPWNGTRAVLFAATDRPTHGLDVTGYLAPAAAALRAHDAYLSALGWDLDPEAYLRDLTGEAGRRSGVDAAIAFELVAL